MLNQICPIIRDSRIGKSESSTEDRFAIKKTFDSVTNYSLNPSEKRGIDFGLGRGYSGSQVLF